MEHHHTAEHGRPLADPLNSAFIAGITLNILFVIAELAAGAVIGSIGLLSDAGHNFLDVISLALAMFAFRLSKINGNERFTYGYKKGTVLVSLLNALFLLAAVVWIVSESVEKLTRPAPVDGGVIALVAGIGVIVNAATAWLFLRGKEHDLNVKGAFLHMAADALVSFGVVVSGVVIFFTGWTTIDPILGLAISGVIVVSTWGLLKESLRLCFDAVPVGIDQRGIEAAFLSDPAVRGVHHLHIWAISTTENALTAHVVIEKIGEMDAAKIRLKARLRTLGIDHATLEFERVGSVCADAAGGPPSCAKKAV